MPTKRFSTSQAINQKNLCKVPADKPGVYRIMDANDNILFIGMVKGGRLNESIYEHRGRFMKGTRFQYRTTSSKQEAERLEHDEILKHIPPRIRRKPSSRTSAR